MEIPPDRLPPQPFTDAERVTAQKVGLQLRLRVDRAPDGAPLTMRKMEEIRASALQNSGRKLLGDASLYQSEAFYLTETPSFGWAFTSKGILPNSTSKDFIEQVELAIVTLRDSLPEQNAPLRKVIEAIRQWDGYLGKCFGPATPLEIREILQDTDRWQIYADELAAQPLVPLLLPSAADVLFDQVTSQVATQTSLIGAEAGATRTRSQYASSGFVIIDEIGVMGASVGSWKPGEAHGGLGLVFSCTSD